MNTDILSTDSPVTEIARPVSRHCYRCTDCLAVWFVEGKFERRMDCACGSPAEYMGRVRQEVLVKTETRCACDGRCTNAFGPSCDCSCGGKNHGTGAVVEVEYVAGAVPKAKNAPCLIRKLEFRQAVEDLTKKLEALDAELKVLTHTLGDDAWRKMLNLRNLVYRAKGKLTKAKKSRAHKSRMALLTTTLQGLP